jgi:hypothetical protein
MVIGTMDKESSRSHKPSFVSIQEAIAAIKVEAATAGIGGVPFVQNFLVDCL